MEKYIAVFYAAWVVLLSLLDFILYGADKKRAVKGEFRIRERTLLLLAFFGGGIGAAAGSLTFRHKTKKWYFTLVNLVSVLYQAALLAFLILRAVRG